MTPTEIPQRVMPGLVTWKNELGFRVTCWLYHSDPAKRGTWLEEVAASVPGGIASDHIRQEILVDPFVLRGRPTYYGWSQARNVVHELPCDITEFRRWTWFLSADFGSGGGATCWLFWAENPRSGDLIIFDEVYVDASFGKDERTPEHVKPLVYDRLRHWAGVPMTMPLDFRAVVKYAVGDPSGLAYMQEYHKSPMPIYVGGGSSEAKVKLNDVDAGEARLNAYFSASFTCCASADNPEGRWYANRGVCPRCRTEKVGRPRLTVLESGAPHLIKQIPTIRKKLSRHAVEKEPEGNVRVEDHAEASARYGAMSRPVRRLALVANQDERPARELSVANSFWQSVQNRLEHGRLASLFDEDEDSALAADGSRRYHEREEGGGGVVVGGPW